ncbi:MAG: hypothetical protein M1829_003983 [Trizodia sp. TS-e1964]|nr:MAG: hypothetical protein M1829_003983 [Trizodia sp. TS-e1964]
MNFLGSVRDRMDSLKKNAKNEGISGSRLSSNNPFTPTSTPTRRPNRAGMNAFTVPSNEPPPAYTPSGPSAPAARAPADTLSPSTLLRAPSTIIPRSSMSHTQDDPYAFLSTFDTVFLIDDSGSMAGRSWRETSAALRTVTPICTAHDIDGVDIYFLNHPDSVEYKNITAPRDIERIFASVRPSGGTPTGTRLNQLLKPYLAAFALAPETTKPLNIIVITDGVPSDDVESVVIGAARKLDQADAPAWQVGIQFFQVGNEQGAAEALQELDDGLAEMGGVRDIVDTVPWKGANGDTLDGEGILKVVLGAVNRRLDRKKNTKEAVRRR